MSLSRNEHPLYSIQYNQRFATLKLTNYLQSIIPKNQSSYVIACIGTDRSTGDSLGPLTGSLLERYPLQTLKVYGTLHKPLHALNLLETIDQIKETHDNPFIIALDASLGSLQSVGTIFCGIGSLKPGSALKKDLPEVGQAYISATVNLNSEINYITLQNTRLSLVYDMAKVLASSLYRLDRSINQRLTLK
ncbi:MAG TPA: spore protease YyaC [Pseudogracilibacillus sp.]|nr:spore protease YyaC [Pseudogracilibacillus sp.]